MPQRVLTGIQSSGDLHIGNYFGSVMPSVELQNDGQYECFYFIANWHSLTTQHQADQLRENQKQVITQWLALGIDPEKSVFFRQSDVPAHVELMWYLSCLSPLGLLQRAHAFKDKSAKGLDVNIGLLTYPVLMAADIILYDINLVPVGHDQRQHVEMARDMAIKFNTNYGDTFVLPEALIRSDTQTILGTDGHKMSKSYGNTIPVFDDQKNLVKKIMSIKTDSAPLGEVLDPDKCPVLAYHRLFDNPNLPQLEKDYLQGKIGYGESKKQLCTLIWDYFAEYRERYRELSANPQQIEDIMQRGIPKARAIADHKLQIIRERVGIQ